MKNQKRRARYFIDKKVQGALLVRAARYWITSIVVVSTLTILGWMFVSPGIVALMSIREQLPSVIGALLVAVIASLLVLPVLLFDLNRITNRFAGPAYRLRCAMKMVAEGQTVAPVHFRDGDFWQEMADSFNEVVARIERLEQNPDQTCQCTDDDPVMQINNQQRPLLEEATMT